MSTSQSAHEQWLRQQRSQNGSSCGQGLGSDSSNPSQRPDFKRRVFGCKKKECAGVCVTSTKQLWGEVSCLCVCVCVRQFCTVWGFISPCCCVNIFVLESSTGARHITKDHNNHRKLQMPNLLLVLLAWKVQLCPAYAWNLTPRKKHHSM